MATTMHTKLPALLQAYTKKKAQSLNPLRIAGDCALFPLRACVLSVKIRDQTGKIFFTPNLLVSHSWTPVSEELSENLHFRKQAAG